MLHGTRELAAAGTLLQSTVDGATLGALRPDALVKERTRVVGVLDAKYKQLHPTPLSPTGPQREDLYQLAAYLARFGAEPSGVWACSRIHSTQASHRFPTPRSGARGASTPRGS